MVDADFVFEKSPHGQKISSVEDKKNPPKHFLDAGLHPLTYT